MNVLATILSSSIIRYGFFLIIIGMLGYAVHLRNQRTIELEKQKIAYEITISRLKEVVKEKEAYTEQLEAITKEKSELVNELIQKQDALNDKIKKIELEVAKKVGQGKDRESSEILKHVIKELSGQ